MVLEIATNMRNDGGVCAETVLVVGDDELVGEQIALKLAGAGRETRHVTDFQHAFNLCASGRIHVLVIDQIVECEEGARLLRLLKALGGETPQVVLLRYAHGPIGLSLGLPLAVVAGENWFEDLPQVVSARAYARAS